MTTVWVNLHRDLHNRVWVPCRGSNAVPKREVRAAREHRAGAASNVCANSRPLCDGAPVQFHVLEKREKPRVSGCARCTGTLRSRW